MLIKRSSYPKTMRFSLTGKYAIQALVRLAQLGGGPVSVHELAAQERVPQPYLAKLVPLLVRAGILDSVRGRGGGISFATPPESVTLAQILRVTDGPDFLGECPLSLNLCSGNPLCPLADLWDPVRDKLLAFLEQTTVATLAARLNPKFQRREHDERAHKPKKKGSGQEDPQAPPRRRKPGKP